MYDIKSNIATDFIDHNEILESIAEAREKAADREYVESLIERSKDCKGLSHREAATLLECDDPELTQRIFDTAREIKQRFYGNRIVMFAPLYLSNYCVNGCVYCPYHLKNKTIPRPDAS